jgi:single-stranded-DNA-specific exonuclease
MERAWVVAEPVGDAVRQQFPELPLSTVQLLYNRGLATRAQIDEFLAPEYRVHVHDPFLFRDMEKAVERLLTAIREKQKILVHGDYDADGICAATLMVTMLESLGATVDVFLPHRERDGYGLNAATVTQAIADNVRVIVTCDCGIANTAEIATAQAAGIDVIITDHHAMPAVLPEAYATIHPKVPGETYPWDGLAGGGVAFKLVQALQARVEGAGFPALPSGFDKWLLDLVAISSVADMVPLLGETRTLVKFGLLVLAKTKRVGLRKVMEAAGVFEENGLPKQSIDAGTIGFQIAPRINAAGRLDHARRSFDVLMEKDPLRATAFAAALHETNADRQRQTEKCVLEARAQVAENGWEEDAAIVVAGDWPPGLVGLVAGRLCEQFYRPVFAVSLKESAVGSGRSIPGYHVVQAMQSFPEVFEKFGGHPQACGFTVKEGMVDALRNRLREHAAAAFAGKELKPTLLIDAEIALEAMTWDFYETVRQFEPFGIGNPEPRFVARQLRVVDCGPVGGEGKHLRLSVAHHSGEQRKMIAFGFGAMAAELFPGAMIDAVFTVGVNTWKGNRELQLKVVDMRVRSEEG